MPVGATRQHRVSYEHIYDTIGIRDSQKFYRWIARLVPLQSNWRVLDIACGEGGLVAAMRNGNHPVECWGLDVAQAALAKARVQNPQSPLILGEAEQLPFTSASFDYVTCLGSLENFRDTQQALREIYRVLKTDGTLCAMMPNKYWLGDILDVALAGKTEATPFQAVDRVASCGQWKRLLEWYGFRVKRTYGYVKTTPLVSAGKLRSLRKFLITHLLAAISPPSLAWSIVYVCDKRERLRTREHEPFVWRAEVMNDA